MVGTVLAAVSAMVPRWTDLNLGAVVPDTLVVLVALVPGLVTVPLVALVVAHFVVRLVVMQAVVLGDVIHSHV